MADEHDKAMAALREVEVEWLADTLGRSIANLGYPVGIGTAPHPEQLKRAAETLFDRYSGMIQMARREGFRQAATQASEGDDHG